MSDGISQRVVGDLIQGGVDFVTTVPCKQLAGVIDELDKNGQIHHVPSNKEDEGMGLCAGAYMGGKTPCIIMQNTALGVTINTLATLIQFYQIPLPMLMRPQDSRGRRRFPPTDGARPEDADALRAMDEAIPLPRRTRTLCRSGHSGYHVPSRQVRP